MKKKVAVVAVALCLVIAPVALCACTPSVDKLKDKFTKEGYHVEAISTDGFEDAKVEYAFTAFKGGDGIFDLVSGAEEITVVCFSNSDDAKTFYEKAKESAEQFEELTGVKTSVKKKGNAIASGTEGALKLF